jgi:hypothetical protein
VPAPTNLTDEQKRWTDFREFIFKGADPLWTYDPGASELTVKLGDL